MKSLIYILITCLLALTHSAFANTLVYVKDKNTKENIPGVTIHFKSLEGRSKDSTSLALSDKFGKAINPYKGRTLILLSNIAYKRILDTLNGSDKCFYMQSSDIVMDRVVVTGQITPASTQKSVYNVKVIGQNKIKAQAANNLQELLTTESNIRISQDNILGSSININGISGANIKILQDGIPIIGRLNGNIDLSQINLNNVKNVEIIEGPMSTIYGSDALGGVINLISKKPQCERLEFEAGSYLESVGKFNFDASLRYSYKELSLMLNAGRNLFQGYDLNDDDRRDLQWNPKEQYFADLGAAYTIDNHNIRFSSKYFNEYILNRGSLRPPYFETAFDDKYRTNRITNSLFYNAKFGDKHFLNITTAYSYYNRKKNTYFKDMLTLDETLTNSPSDQDTSVFDSYVLRAVYSNDKLTKILKYQLGVDCNFDHADGKKIKNNSQHMNDIAAFLSLQIDTYNNCTIHTALRVIENSKYNAPIIPSINLKYDPFENLIFRISYAKGFRAPSIKELYYQFVDINHNIYGNEELDAEKSDSYNASVFFSINNETQYICFEPKFFYNKINDMITLANIDGDTYKNINIGSYETIGSNLTVKYVQSKFSLKSVLSYTGRSNSLHKTTDAPKFSFSPEISLSADYKIEAIDSKLSLFYKYTGEMPAFTLVDNQAQEYFIEDYHTLDLSISRHCFDLFDIVIGAKNLFDVNNIKSSRSVSSGVHSSSSSLPVAWADPSF